MSEEVLDALLIGWICVFLLLKAVLVRRESRLGWALALANAAIGSAYLYALGARAWPPLGEADLVLDGIRVAVAAAVSWSVWELLRARFGGRRPLARAWRAKLRGRVGRR